CRLFPVCPASSNLFIREIYIDGIVYGINFNDVIVMNEADKTAFIGFRCDMSYDEPVRPPRKTTIRDQSDGFSKTCPDDQSGWFQHFWHAGRSFRSFVFDDDNIAWFNASGSNAFC